MYSGALVGVLGATVRPTNVDRVLCIDTRPSDFHARPAYPTFLYYNPHPHAVKINIDLGSAPAHVWDGVSNAWLRRDASGDQELSLAADTAAVVTIVPATAQLASSGQRLAADGIIVDFNTKD